VWMQAGQIIDRTVNLERTSSRVKVQ